MAYLPLMITDCLPGTWRKMSSTRIVEWASVNHGYTAVTDGLVIRASPPDSLVAKIFKSHVLPDSLWALVIPARSIVRVSVPGDSTLAVWMSRVWVSVATPSLAPVTELSSESLVAEL